MARFAREEEEVDLAKAQSTDSGRSGLGRSSWSTGAPEDGSVVSPTSDKDSLADESVDWP